MVLSALAEGLDPSAAERVAGLSTRHHHHLAVPSWGARAHPARALLLPTPPPAPAVGRTAHAAALRQTGASFSGWPSIPSPRFCRRFSLAPEHKPWRMSSSTRSDRAWPPFCLPLFTSDGLNLSFYALTAHFGHWLQVRRRGREGLRWQVADGLIYGQVKKIYRRRKLVRVRHVMRLGTQAALSVALQGMGLSGRLNTAFIERGNLTIRHAIAAASSSHLGDGAAVPTPVSSSGVVACLLSFCASSHITPSCARAAARARWQTSGATLPAANTGDGSWQNPSTMHGTRGTRMPFTAGSHLKADEAQKRLKWSVARKLGKGPSEEMGRGFTLG
jgi:hypothetical protein